LSAAVELLDQRLEVLGAHVLLVPKHRSFIFDDSSTWELPPLNSLYKGTVDSIHRSHIPRDRFESAWMSAQALTAADLVPGGIPETR
jgi:hypothetical protein